MRAESCCDARVGGDVPGPLADDGKPASRDTLALFHSLPAIRQTVSAISKTDTALPIEHAIHPNRTTLIYNSTKLQKYIHSR